MGQAVSAAGMDRLPWLSDEPTSPKRRGSNREAAGWAVAATLLVAGVSYWMGAHSWRQSPPAEIVLPRTTVPLPQPRSPEPAQPRSAVQSSQEVMTASTDEARRSRMRVTKRIAEASSRPRPEVSTPAPVDSKPVAIAQAILPQQLAAAGARPLSLWPATQSQGAYGRIVRIGAFGSRLQAKLGWRYMVEAYPAVAHLPATVVGARNSRGRPFYRFQIGTTSQAHSEVLCQRMEKIHLSCAVVGLPWRPAGVER